MNDYAILDVNKFAKKLEAENAAAAVEVADMENEDADSGADVIDAEMIVDNVPVATE